ncbi:MAG: tetratricopeptide repeat protein [Chlorobi bacterium]|nr:tetratricopeptide repeat protein [Chlorobiota bacterium]
MRISKVYLIAVFVFLFTGLKATSVTDSLEQLLTTAQDTVKVKLLSDLCWEYRFISADTALQYGNMALELAREINYPKGIAQAYNDMGIIYIDRSYYSKAIGYFQKAMEIRQKQNDKAGMASLYNKIGIVYQKQGKLKEALQNQISALKIYEELGQDLWIGYCLNNIAIIHLNLGNLEKSLEYNLEALKYREKMNDVYGKAGSYGNIANVYLKMKDTAKAVSYYNNALTTFRQIKNNEAISAMLSNLGNIYLAQGKNRKALELLNESLEIREKMGDKKAISSSLLKIGEAYTNLGLYDKAAAALYKAMNIAKKIKVLEEETSAYLVIAKMYAMKGNLDSAFAYTRRYIVLKDSVYDQRLKQQIVEVQVKYETEKMERDNQLLSQQIQLKEARLKQRKTEVLLLIFLVISITGAAIFFFYRRHQKQKAALNAEIIRHNQEQLKAVITGQENERRHIARELHDSVGQRLAAIKLGWEKVAKHLQNSENYRDLREMVDMLDTASKEVREISHQMMPKELEQFGLPSAIKSMLDAALKNTGISYEFNHFGLEKRLPPTVELNLFRILQELTSNVIRHAEADKIDIQLLNRNKKLVLIFEDNGKGFDPGSSSGGIGMMNIESRVKAMDAEMDIESHPGEGTTVRIRIPVNE